MQFRAAFSLDDPTLAAKRLTHVFREPPLRFSTQEAPVSWLRSAQQCFTDRRDRRLPLPSVLTA